MTGRAAARTGGFRIDLTAVSDNAGIEAQSLLGQAVRIDLLTQRSHTTLRPFHGHVTRFERVGANGGLARYRMVVEPWLALIGGAPDDEEIDNFYFRLQASLKLEPTREYPMCSNDTSTYMAQCSAGGDHPLLTDIAGLPMPTTAAVA
ncbi:contractile injection system protein, VgrG/Pvc8 family [Cupriavidus taiwanensis]|uniref:contractile injection system protein, VgrG/Pvc8 family n=1 Tax=Cupriavidus taiwanensis TaxID=164546 RepID=UPI000E1813E9|nr:contractile injection system protein, VgrG/Pvc8 family [Cupriavidus taiwanensis]SPC16447.1 hypothetical protein CT19431_MP130174 [Cupriavidus taiwanensis]